LVSETLELVRLWTPVNENNESYHIFQIPPEILTIINAFRNLLYTNIRTRMAKVLNEDFYKHAAFLSPKYKRLTMLTESERLNNKNKMIRLMRTKIILGKSSQIRNKIQFSIGDNIEINFQLSICWFWSICMCP